MLESSPTKAVRNSLSHMQITEDNIVDRAENKKAKWNPNSTLRQLIAQCENEDLNISISGCEINVRKIKEVRK